MRLRSLFRTQRGISVSVMSGIILLSSKGRAPGLLRLCLATTSLLAMTGNIQCYFGIIPLDSHRRYVGAGCKSRCFSGDKPRPYIRKGNSLYSTPSSPIRKPEGNGTFQKRPHKHSVFEGSFYDHTYSFSG